jgi:uracil permease
MIKIIPILLGVVASYAAGVCMGEVDFTAVKEAAWFGFPIRMETTVFALFGENFNGETLFASILTIMPIALATIVEHVGDVSAISSTTGINYIKDPGLHRTMLGDGLATVLSSVFGGPANTTYGENTGVLNLSKVYDPAVVRLAAVFAILFSFCPKVASVIQVMPTATVGGISLILYGMISAVGVRNVVENQVDFTKSRNVIIAALILVLAIGVNYSNAGAIVFHIGELTISLSGLAAGALAGTTFPDPAFPA